ncbi:hypothetical protein RJ639_013910 [Escallonia herrerae]|uniref:F-box/kelch-repeat protein SKIP25 n=1 Tax=Escallonia herrerae TaxID=1293975 RepID=A0AA89AP63_9ASTE|nr:hypothetical protein RJ639_013910 [Escallonia herrerae]
MSTTLKHSKSESSSDKVLHNESTTLIPGLPNHLAHLCLFHLHPALLYPVCSSWRRLIYSPSFPPFPSLYVLLSPRTSDEDSSNSLEFFSFDLISSTWCPLPSPPSDPPLRLLYRHPSFISRNLPVQSLTVSGHLVLIAASTHHFFPALPRPLVFHPLSKQWFFGPPLPAPRRWCVAGSADGTVYVASGIGANYQPDVARSIEKWDLKKNSTEWRWEKLAELKDGRFSREAVEAVGFRDKLCMVNVKGHAMKEGAVYDVVKDKWEKMPEGMLAGWNGPAASNEEDVMYVVDDEKGGLKKYDMENDCWQEVIESSERLKGAEQIAVGRGRLCAAYGNGGRIAVVDVARPARAWFVHPPPEMEVVAVHILPRMNRQL